MHSKTAGILLCITALLLLRQGIAWVDGHLDIRRQQAGIIRARDIDPAALFYTESALALAAEKEVRASLK